MCGVGPSILALAALQNLVKERVVMSEKEEKECVDEGRREALRKSVYAVYATPLITAVLVNKASAQSIGSPGNE